MKKIASTTLLSIGLLSANIFASDQPVMASDQPVMASSNSFVNIVASLMDALSSII